MDTFCVGQPMKKSGMQRRVEVVSITTEKRGMVFRERPTFFMMTPPISIPTATAGRLTAPGKRTDPVMSGDSSALSAKLIREGEARVMTSKHEVDFGTLAVV